MRVLVIDDKQLHRTAAVQTLQGHDLTLVDSYDEAQRVLGREVPYQQLKAWAAAHGHDSYLGAPPEVQEQALDEPAQNHSMWCSLTCSCQQEGARWVARVSSTSARRCPSASASRSKPCSTGQGTLPW